MDVPECNVCNLPLDEDEHQPRHLGCSHDACTTCVKELINNESFECPMCRKVIRASKAEDLPINHGVVQILRLLKGFVMSEKNPKVEGATENMKEICRVHENAADKRCVSCKLWVCASCEEFHTPDLGCKIQDYKSYIMSTKQEHRNKVEPTLLSIRKNIKSLSSELSDLANEKKRIEEKIKKLQKAVENGTMTIDKFAIAAANVEKASTSMDLNRNLTISNEWYRHAQIWRKKNVDQCNLIEKLRSDQNAYTSLEINGKSYTGKVMFKNEHMYLHCFKVNGLSDMKSLNVFPYELIKTYLPTVCDVVFLDLAICGEVKGRVTIKLRQDLPTYAKHLPSIFTGEEGFSLHDQKCHEWNDYDLSLSLSSIGNAKHKFTRDTNAGCRAVQGSILADWSGKGLDSFRIYYEQSAKTYDVGNRYEVFGQVETGLDIVKLCRKHSKQNEVTVVDCGIDIQEEALQRNPSALI